MYRMISRVLLMKIYEYFIRPVCAKRLCAFDRGTLLRKELCKIANKIGGK